MLSVTQKMTQKCEREKFSKFMNTKTKSLARALHMTRKLYYSSGINMALEHGSVEHEIFPQADANKKIVSISIYGDTSYPFFLIACPLCDLFTNNFTFPSAPFRARFIIGRFDYEWAGSSEWRRNGEEFVITPGVGWRFVIVFNMGRRLHWDTLWTFRLVSCLFHINPFMDCL